MSKYTGDLVRVGIARETTRGTAVPPTFEMKWTDLSMVDKTIMAQDESRSGIIAGTRNAFVVGTFAEGDLAGPIRDKSFALVLYSLFGTLASAVVETTAYEHTLTVQDGCQHQSLTLYKGDSNSASDHALAMVSGCEITMKTNEMNMFKANIRSKARASMTLGTFTVTIAAPGLVTLSAHRLATGDAVVPTTTGALPTGLTAGTTYYVIVNDANSFWLATTLANALAATKITTTGSQSGTHTMTLSNHYMAAVVENTFLPQHTTFKLASLQSGLDGASAFNVRSLKLNINQDVEDDRSLGSTAPSDIINRLFTVDLEVEFVVSADTYITALLAGTSYAARVDMTNTDVTIGASTNPRVRFDLYRVILEDAPPAYSRGELTIQTLKFKGHYYETDTQQIKAYVRNLTASY